MKFGLLFLLQDPPNGEHIPHMILMLRHPTGPSHQETLQCIERLGSKVLPQCR